MTDAEWFNQRVRLIFGDERPHTDPANFLILAGDHRSLKTIMRTLSNVASGKHRVSGELRVVLNLLATPGSARGRVEVGGSGESLGDRKISVDRKGV